MCTRFDSDKYSEVVTEIHEQIERICNLAQDDIDPGAAQYKRSLPSTLDNWLNIQAHTSRIFNAISSVWPQNCVFHTHHAKLRLDIPTEDQADYERPKINASFSNDKRVDSGDCSPRQWRDVAVISCQTSSLKYVDKFYKSVQSFDIVVPIIYCCCCCLPFRVFRKTIRFSPPSIDTGPVQTWKLCTSESKIDNLCTVLEEGTQVSCLGFLPSEGWHYHIHDPANSSRKLTRLRDILTSQKITTRQK